MKYNIIAAGSRSHRNYQKLLPVGAASSRDISWARCADRTEIRNSAQLVSRLRGKGLIKTSVFSLNNPCILTNRPFYYKLIPEMDNRILTIIATFIIVVTLSPFGIAEDKEPLTQEEKARQKMLKVEAANALWRLKNSLEKDAFYSGRIRLNVWRSTAIEAGTFDQAQYDEFKQQLYVKSVNDSMKCYEAFILEEDFYNANICLQTWRMHSKELGTYDKAQYEAFKEKLKQAKVDKAAREAAAQKTEETQP